MTKEDKRAWMKFIAGSGVIVAIMMACWIISSYFEANAFNRLTGRSVTTWDAMFVQLRVDDD